ncbi:MAG TPA: hypothetical protein VJ259_03740 [Actinomycetota bacterium]|nr:hypothetical protein [Actinomycetota bacterium]
MTREDVPLRIRAVVAVFLSAFLVCGLAGVEAWPLSGFRLFSHLRTDRPEGWPPGRRAARSHRGW